jgi:hypothetical protein
MKDVKDLVERLNVISQSEELASELYRVAKEDAEMCASVGMEGAPETLENIDNWVLPDMTITQVTVEQLLLACRKDPGIRRFFCALVENNTPSEELFRQGVPGQLYLFGTIASNQAELSRLDHRLLPPEEQKVYRSLVRDWNVDAARQLEVVDMWGLAEKIDGAIGSPCVNIATVYLIIYILYRHADLWQDFQQYLLAT